MTMCQPKPEFPPYSPIGPRTATFICKARSFQLSTTVDAVYSRQQLGGEAHFLWLIADRVILAGSLSLSCSLTDAFRSGRRACVWSIPSLRPVWLVRKLGYN